MTSHFPLTSPLGGLNNKGISMFDVKIKETHGALFLCNTHNGSVWNSIPIKNPEYEIPLIIKALKDCLIAECTNFDTPPTGHRRRGE